MRQYLEFSDSFINNLELKLLLQGYAEVKADTWRYDQVVSPFNRLYMVRDGKGRIFNATHTVPLRKGYAYLIPLNATYSYACDSFLKKFFIHFTLEIYPGLDIFNNTRTCLAVKIPDPAMVPELVRQARSGALKDNLRYKASLLAMIAPFVTLTREQVKSDLLIATKYRKFFACVDSHCVHGISLASLADSMHMSLPYLSSSFKRDTGSTMKHYINSRLAQIAKEKLLSNKRVKEIACELRFEDEFYFSRFFKKHVGLSPRQYWERNYMQ